MSDESKCTNYANNTSSYDMCKFGELEKYFKEEIGCSVPYLNSTVPICRNSTAIEKVLTVSNDVLTIIFFQSSENLLLLPM